MDLNRPATPLDEAAKCVLVSMDSTLKSNLSVGLPLDLVVYENNRLETQQIVCIDERNPYFQMIRSSWGEKLRQVFESIDDPQWDGAGADTLSVCCLLTAEGRLVSVTSATRAATSTGSHARSRGR